MRKISDTTYVTLQALIDLPEGARLVSKLGEPSYIIMPNGEVVVATIGFANAERGFFTMEEIRENIGAMEYIDVSMRELTEADLLGTDTLTH